MISGNRLIWVQIPAGSLIKMEPGRQRKAAIEWAHSKVPGLETFANLLRFLVEKRLIVLLGIAAFALLFFFWAYVKALFVMAAFIALGAASMAYNRWVKLSLGVELVTLGMVITSLAFGRAAGLFVGVVGLFLAEVLYERFTYSTFVSFIGIAVIAIIAPAVHSRTGDITATGILLAIVYDAVIIPGYLLLGSSLGRSALFIVTHIAFNIWVFTFVAPLLLRIAA